MSVDVDTLRRQQAQGLVVGVKPRSGPPALRLEIDDFMLDSELVNLYFLALEAFMAPGVSRDPFSYYEISGIHGEPARPWDGVTSVNFPPPKRSPEGGRTGGYCAHGSVLFPTWHRVYLSMFEQALFLHAASIAPRLGSVAMDALNRFRIPYWDPLLPRQRLPDRLTFKYGIPVIFTLPRVLVRRPENPNTTVEMDNPLYRFKFPTDSNSVRINWSVFQAPRKPTVDAAVRVNTIRGYDGTSPNSNHSYVITTFDNVFNPITGRASDSAGRLWRVMFENKDYVNVSNHYMPQNRLLGRNPNANSIEGYHDDGHVMLARGPITQQGMPAGHMNYPAVAGFDPVFWLHHANIDRIFAIWQGIHSADAETVQWWSSLDNIDGTFVEPAGVPETSTTALAPFRRARNGTNVTWWTSNDARDIRTLGYDYPQIAVARATGNVVLGLRTWANAELGWADPRRPHLQPGNPVAIANFTTSQMFRQVPSLVSTRLIDGTVPFPPGTDYLSSLSRFLLGPIRPPPWGWGPPVFPFDDLIVNGPDTQNVLASAISSEPSSFEDRYGGLGKLVSEDGKMVQWNATLRIEKYALNGSFLVHFFLGDFSADPDAVWLHDENRAATSSIFANSDAVIEAGGCENCEHHATQKSRYYDTVGLTQALLTYVRGDETPHGLALNDLDPENVVPFLQRNLHWRVVDSRGEEIPRTTIDSLRIGVYSETVTLPRELTDVPVFADQTMRYQVTQGRPGGLNDGEEL